MTIYSLVCTPFPIWNQLVILCLVLTVASWPTYKFFRRQVKWSGTPISSSTFQFIVIHRVKGFSVVNEAEVDFFFLEFPCFYYDPADFGNLFFGSSAFSKSSLNIWKFTVQLLLKSSLENFEHYYCVRWVQLCGSLSILWHCLSLRLEWKLTFSSSVATAEFSKFAGVLNASP